MEQRPTRRTLWFTIVVMGAIATVTHALSFDWSDVDVFGVIGGVTIVCALKWPRASAVAIAVILVSVIAGHLIPALHDWPEAAEIEAGDTWASVQQKLGPPSYEAPTFAAARNLKTGYAIPSPLRFRHSGPVGVFTRGDRALWVFHDRSRVNAVFRRRKLTFGAAGRSSFWAVLSATSHQAARRTASNRLSHSWIGFQLALFWSTRPSFLASIVRK